MFAVATAIGQVSDGLYIKEYAWRMHSLYYPKTPGCDSVYADRYSEMWYYDSDSLFRKIAAEGRTREVEDLLQHYYFQIMDYMPVEKRRAEHGKMNEAARRYGSSLLKNEADFMEIIIEMYPLDTAGNSFEAKIDKMNELVERAVRRGDRNSECMLLFEIFQIYKTHKNYAKAFSIAPTVLQKAELLTVEECPMLRIIYSFIGNAYYFFEDYDRAFFCMRKVESLNGILFADRHSFEVKEKFALYYASLNQLDSSDYYFRSMYDSNEKVRFRAMYDVVAASGIAANMVKRHEYDRAIPLLERWYPEAVREYYPSAVDITVNLAECFICKNQFSKALPLIDSARALMAEIPVNLMLCEKLYKLQSNYYKAIGNAQMAILYNDSARIAAMQHTAKTDAIIILRAEQELFEAEKAFKDEKITLQQSRIFFISVIFMLSLSAFVVLIFLYRKKQAAYRKLIVKSRQWAGIIVTEDRKSALDSELECTQIDLPDASDLSLMKEIELLISGKELYKNPALTLDILAKELQVKRNYVSRAINRCRNINFNAYINEYRIKEAIQILSGSNHGKKSIEDIALQVGFNDRSVFSRAFKKITGLPPGSFISNR
jgi:AraC-like DNA-binding protein